MRGLAKSKRREGEEEGGVGAAGSDVASTWAASGKSLAGRCDRLEL
jgi:hypothetical protein